MPLRPDKNVVLRLLYGDRTIYTLLYGERTIYFLLTQTFLVTTTISTPTITPIKIIPMCLLCLSGEMKM